MVKRNNKGQYIKGTSSPNYWLGKDQPESIKANWIKPKQHLSSKTEFKKGKPSAFKGRKFSEESRAKLSQSLKGRLPWNKGKKGVQKAWNKGVKMPQYSGANHWSWKGGITPEIRKIRNSLEYKLWREAVFERDDYTCQICFKRGVEIHADHIKPFAYYPELRFAIDNGRTLCAFCHKTTETYGVKIRWKYERQSIDNG